MQATRPLAHAPLEYPLETTFLTPNFRTDLRTGAHNGVIAKAR